MECVCTVCGMWVCLRKYDDGFNLKFLLCDTDTDTQLNAMCERKRQRQSEFVCLADDVLYSAPTNDTIQNIFFPSSHRFVRNKWNTDKFRLWLNECRKWIVAVAVAVEFSIFFFFFFSHFIAIYVLCGGSWNSFTFGNAGRHKARTWWQAHLVFSFLISFSFLFSRIYSVFLCFAPKIVNKSSSGNCLRWMTRWNTKPSHIDGKYKYIFLRLFVGKMSLFQPASQNTTRVWTKNVLAICCQAFISCIHR